MNNNIYISTVAFAGKDADDIINTACENNWAIEFSSGLPYMANMEEIYLSAPVKKIPHNYFPAPAEPFVLNLASKNEVIRKRSIQHCINGLHLAKKSNAPFFAAHAGFCIDPDPSELGRQLIFNVDFTKQHNWQFFLDSIKEILDVAAEIDVQFLVENNVITAFNLVKNINPLFCCESTDIVALFNLVNNPYFGLLLDTAHLKVSCVTLDLNRDVELKKIKSYIKGIHHSDSDGKVDNNQLLKADYWFLPFMKEYKNNIHVIEVKNLNIKEIKEHINLLEQYAN